MAELTEDELITKINAIDAQILTITDAISATAGANLVDYSIGGKSVSASQKLKILNEARKVYQDLLEQMPKVIVRSHQYEKEKYTGVDESEFVGDE